MGTDGYLPPEGPGSPTADIYSLGKVLWETSMGRPRGQFADSVTATLPALPETPEAVRFNEIVLKACELNPRKRFASSVEMHDALRLLQTGKSSGTAAPAGPVGTASVAVPLSVVILYRANAQPDDRVAGLLEEQLRLHEFEVYVDKPRKMDAQSVRELEEKLQKADVVIPLLSASSVQSEMLSYELELAADSANRKGPARFIPVRINYSAALPESLGPILNPWRSITWQGPQDHQSLVAEILRVLHATETQSGTTTIIRFESIGGAVPLDSQFYIERAQDDEFQAAVMAGESIVLVKGARQMGKTSLLARSLQNARQRGTRVVLTDFQKLNSANLESLDRFYLTLGDSLAEQLDLDTFPGDSWDTRRSPNFNFERFLQRHVLVPSQGQIVWGMDEVDRLFSCSFRNEVFGLFRSWHNNRALDPAAPWKKLTLAIAYATEAHLFITDLTQSPFNVGIRLGLDDFTPGQVAELNRRYGEPLKTQNDLDRFVRLLGGQPFLVRAGLHEMASNRKTMEDLEEQATQEEGVFGDHLRRISVSLAKDQALVDALQSVIAGKPCPNAESFFRLRTAGLLLGDSPLEGRIRCQLYAMYLQKTRT